MRIGKVFKTLIKENNKRANVISFLLDFGMFITMNLSKVTQEANSNEGVTELNSMLSFLRKPLVNGMVYSQITNDMDNIIGNPKLLSAVFLQIRNLLVYIKPRVEKYVNDGRLKSIWLGKITDFENRYKDIIN